MGYLLVGEKIRKKYSFFVGKIYIVFTVNLVENEEKVKIKISWDNDFYLAQS